MVIWLKQTDYAEFWHPQRKLIRRVGLFQCIPNMTLSRPLNLHLVVDISWVEQSTTVLDVGRVRITVCHLILIPHNSQCWMWYEQIWLLTKNLSLLQSPPVAFSEKVIRMLSCLTGGRVMEFGQHKSINDDLYTSLPEFLGLCQFWMKLCVYSNIIQYSQKFCIPSVYISRVTIVQEIFAIQGRFSQWKQFNMCNKSKRVAQELTPGPHHFSIQKEKFLMQPFLTLSGLGVH